MSNFRQTVILSRRRRIYSKSHLEEIQILEFLCSRVHEFMYPQSNLWQSIFLPRQLPKKTNPI